MKNTDYGRKCLVALIGVASIATLSAPLSAEPLGRPLNAENLGIIDPTNGRYLLLEGLTTTPIDRALPTSLIAIVDSGVASDHPQLAGRVKEEVDFTGEGTRDEIGHGTVVALLTLSSMMAELSLKPKSERAELLISSLKVIDRAGTIRKESLLSALTWLEGKSIGVVNLSLGFVGTYEEHADICIAIGRIKKSLFLAAAGNSGPDVLSYPAACQLDNLISVGRLGPDGQPDPSSGKADIYAPGTAVMVPRANLLLEEGKMLARKGSFEEALAKFDGSIADHPLPETYVQKGLIFFHQKEFVQAEAAFRKAVELKRSIPEGLLGVGLSRYLQNDPKGARQWIEEALDLAPENPKVRFNLALVLMDLKEYVKALEQLDIIRIVNPNYKNLQETIAEIQRRQKLSKN